MVKLQDLTMVELRKMAKKKGLTGFWSLRKKELIQRLSKKTTPTTSYAGKPDNPINDFFTKIFIINLTGKNCLKNLF